MRCLAVFGLLGVIVTGCELAGFAPPTPANPGQPAAPTEVVALAGADIVVVEGARVQLNGAASRALTGVPTLAWSQREGPPVVLSNPSSSTPLFTAPLGPTHLVFELQARADDKADVDEIAVDVVVEAPQPSLTPQVAGSPADIAGAGRVVLEFDWSRLLDAPAAVTARCPLRGDVEVELVGAVVRVGLEPLRLPCSVVVDDGRAPGFGRRGSRVAAIIWPVATATAAATPLPLPPVLAPGAVVALDPALIVAAADGTVLDLVDGAFTAPLQPGHLTLSAEQREGSVSGGVVVVGVDVVAAANAAPTVDGGRDLQVRPGARFRVAASSSDADDDAVTVEVRQVLGAPAQRVLGFADVLTAPQTAGTLLFHVVAFDGVAASAPDPVRVVVDPGAENRAPELLLPATLFTTPGGRFTIDASSARDDSGLIAAWEIVQDETDPVQLLLASVFDPAVVLVAGAAGERYRFRVSAYDEGGLGVSVDVEVVVEAAGPFVDAVRGSDLSGNGSAVAPFASVAAALDTAARHRFPSLLLAAGVHAPVAGRLPDGLGLRGGFVFGAGGYDVGGGPAVLPLSGALFVAGGDLENLSITGTVVVSQDVHIAAVEMSRLGVDVGGRASASDSVFEQLDVDGGAAVLSACAVGELNSRGSTMEVEGSSVDVLLAHGGGLLVIDAGSRLGPTSISSGTNAVLAATLQTRGDAALPVLAIDDATVTLAGARISGGEIAVELRAATLRGSGILSSTRSGVQGSGTLDLQGSHIDVAGDAEAAAIDGDLIVSLQQTVVSSTGVGLRAAEGRLQASIIKSAGVALDFDRGFLRQVTVVSAGRALRLGPVVTVENSVVQGVDVGILPAILGQVGFVISGLDLESIPGCLKSLPNCFFALEGALSADGHLNAEPLHPFVDVGFDLGVPFDVDGDPIPQNAPDLGADERSAL